MNSDIKEIIIIHEQICQRSKELADLINKDYAGKTPILLGMLKGSVPFLAELIKSITIPMEYDFMDVNSYFGGTESTGHIEIITDVTADLKGRDVIIVEDIVDTGFTLQEVMPLIRQKGVNSLEIVCLMDKPSGRKVENLVPKYIGFTVPKLFLVGFGLDYEQKYRNLPFVGVLKEEVYSKWKLH